MFTTKDILAATGAEFRHPEGEARFKTVFQNSKTKVESGLFIAICGHKFDGHIFLEEAFQNGAKAALIQKDKKDKISKNVLSKYPLFVVENTLEALGQLAHYYRSQFSIPILGITGSSGKTTTKDMISKVLSKKFKTHATQGNFNNLIGLPFTIFNLNPTHEISVLEMGMSIPFEVRRLCEIARPTFGLVTNVGTSHLLTMNSIEDVAKAKTDLYRALPKEGTAFLNLDDPYLRKFCSTLKCKIVTYSMQDKKADFFGEIIEDQGIRGQVISVLSSPRSLSSPRKRGSHIKFHLNLLGRHNAMNALAAVTVASTLGVSPKDIVSAMETLSPSKGRGEVIQLKNGSILIDDSYNANPDSMASALKVLKKNANNMTTVAVLGDMLELGKEEVRYHTQIGEIIKELGIDYVLTLGFLSQYYGKKAGANKSTRVFWAKDHPALIQELKTVLKNHRAVVLVKGSRGMALDRVVNELVA